MGLELKDDNKTNTKIVINKSLLFILPLLKLKNNYNIINTYLGDVEEDLFNNKLYILCSIENDLIELNNSFIKKYTTNDGTMYVMSIPDSIKNDYDWFLKGKYSKFSKESKDYLCLNACKNTSKKPHETQMYSILYKTKARKEKIEQDLDVILDNDAEYASIFNDELEIYGLK